MKRIKKSCAFLLALVLITGIFAQSRIGSVFADWFEGEETISALKPSGSSGILAPNSTPFDSSLIELPDEVSSATELWDSLSDAEFTEWVLSSQNLFAVRGLLNDEENETSLAFRDRIDSILDGADAELAERLLTYLSGLSGPSLGETSVLADGDYIYFDLAADDIVFNGNSFSGSIYKTTAGGAPVKISVSGTHVDGNKYYIYQSNDTNRSTTGLVDDVMKLPVYQGVMFNGKSWGEYITDNQEPTDVRVNWEISAAGVGRKSTINRILFNNIAEANIPVVFDNLWSSFEYDPSKSWSESADKDRYPVVATLGKNAIVEFQLKGDNRFSNIHSIVNPSYIPKNDVKTSRLTITSEAGDKETSGTLTLALQANMTKAIVNNYAMLGGGSSKNGYLSLDINGGIVYAGTPKYRGSYWESATILQCIGGRSESYIDINGGVVTAISNSTATAIGGGGGWSSEGGKGFIKITDGKVYAYANSLYVKYNNKVEFIPCTALGSGSCVTKDSFGAKIEISGGEVFAQSVGGVAIGGGGSSEKSGGDATIKITGGKITAISKPGIVAEGYPAVPAGVAIGGGVGNGITGTKGGNAFIDISGSPTIVSGSVGGGSTFLENGQTGYAEVTIRDNPDIIAQFVMAKGGSKPCKFTMGGGTIHDVNTVETNSFIHPDGGILWMDDENGEATITGGIIKDCKAKFGGAVYMTGGKFTMTGGSIETCSATQSGGAVYLGGGNVSIGGGSIQNNTATENGGGLYVTKGKVLMTGGSVSNNNAVNGGGIFVNEGTVTMYGGQINSNHASESGGGVYISAETQSALVDILSGSISNNQADGSGGGVAIVSDSQEVSVVVGINVDHNLNPDRTYAPFAYPEDASGCGEKHVGHTNHISDETHKACPVVRGNHSGEKGGGFFLNGSKMSLTFYCVIEKENTAADPKSNSMFMTGGTVQIVGDSDYDGTGNAKGNIVIESSILVENGAIDVYGEMTNPQFTDDVTVNIQNPDPEKNHFIDHRLYKEDNIHYKVHYNENFKGDSDVATGLYIAKQYPDTAHENDTGDDRYLMTIMSSIFVHPGYKIIGWCTNPDPVSLDPNNPSDGDYWYQVNHTYCLSDLGPTQGMGGNGSAAEEYLLRIYAIWERCGYVLQFDPNVPDGHAYSGTMENQLVTVGLVDGSQQLSKNLFKRKGYLFKGWTLDLEGTGTLYEDEWHINDDFTQEDGKIITLYAQWELCDHKDHLVYTADGNVITQECDACGEHTATATITAVDAIYNGDERTATVEYSSNWIGDKLTISYEMAPSTEWDPKDDVDDNWNETPVPVHAGTYTAKITAGVETASTDYMISPIQWPTPDVPSIIFKVVDGVSRIEITSPVGPEYLYWISRLENGTEHSVAGYEDWGTGVSFESIPVGYYYYFYAKLAADRDHLESTPSQSEAYLATGGNIVYINSDTGIKVEFASGEGNFKYTVTPAEGYHFRDYSDNADTAASSAIPVPGVEYPNAYCQQDGIIVTKETVSGGYLYTVEFVDGQVANYQVTLNFSGAVKDASVTAKAIDGQVFTDFNRKEVVISRDSAFTVNFTLNGLIPVEYQSRGISFGQALPSGSTIILKENGNYWYYRITTATDFVDLRSFTAMGGSAHFSYDTTGTDVEPDKTYQFIVDFSHASSYPAGEILQVNLKLTHSETAMAPDLPLTDTTQMKIGLKDPAQFGMTSSTSGNTANLHFDYTASLGAASIWNGRKTALVLTPLAEIPHDLTLSATVDGVTTVYTQNNAHQFIVLLSSLDDHDVKLTLRSSTFTTTLQTLQFKAEWYVSSSGAAAAPLAGLNAAAQTLSFPCVADGVVSIRIDGDDRLRRNGETLQVTVNYADIPDGASIVASIQEKNGTTFVDTGARITISHDTTSGSENISFQMGTMAVGSYRILVTVSQGGGNLLQVPYYFLIIANP